MHGASLVVRAAMRLRCRSDLRYQAVEIANHRAPIVLIHTHNSTPCAWPWSNITPTRWWDATVSGRGEGWCPILSLVERTRPGAVVSVARNASPSRPCQVTNRAIVGHRWGGQGDQGGPHADTRALASRARSGTRWVAGWQHGDASGVRCPAAARSARAHRVYLAVATR